MYQLYYLCAAFGQSAKLFGFFGFSLWEKFLAKNFFAKNTFFPKRKMAPARQISEGNKNIVKPQNKAYNVYWNCRNYGHHR